MLGDAMLEAELLQPHRCLAPSLLVDPDTAGNSLSSTSNVFINFKCFHQIRVYFSDIFNTRANKITLGIIRRRDGTLAAAAIPFYE